jgi:hypothetical protein
MKFGSDMDFIVLYSNKLKEDSSLFEQQKMFLESQLKASKSLFSNWSGKDFKVRAREYLNKRGLI